MEQLDDDQLDTQLQFERYKQERRRQEAAKRIAAINISDEEQSPEQPLNETGAEGAQPNIARLEQMEEIRTEKPARAAREQPEATTEEPRMDEVRKDANGGE